jgi:hypothetical protein
MRFETILDWFARQLHPEEVRTLERVAAGAPSASL